MLLLLPSVVLVRNQTHVEFLHDEFLRFRFHLPLQEHLLQQCLVSVKRCILIFLLLLLIKHLLLLHLPQLVSFLRFSHLHLLYYVLIEKFLQLPYYDIVLIAPFLKLIHDVFRLNHVILLLLDVLLHGFVIQPQLLQSDLSLVSYLTY